MAPRASWKGFLNLSLVSVPVKAYSASNSGGQIRLNQLCTKCNSRIKQKITCPMCGDLERSEIVKGYEYAKDQYAVIDLDELQKLRAEDEGKAIKIDSFIHPRDLDPLFYSDSSYYLVPEGAVGQKPFALLHRAMSDKGLCCVANVVLHNREQLVLVRPMDDLLCMTILKYAQQVKTTAAFDDELVESNISDAELELANTLIDETTADSFDLERFHDQYTQRLTTLIEAKVNGAEVVEAPSVESPNVINLMEALKASVAKAQNSKPQPATTAKTAGRKQRAEPTMKKAAKTKKKSARKSDEVLAEQLANPPKRRKSSGRQKRTG